MSLTGWSDEVCFIASPVEHIIIQSWPVARSWQQTCKGLCCFKPPHCSRIAEDSTLISAGLCFSFQWQTTCGFEGASAQSLACIYRKFSPHLCCKRALATIHRAASCTTCCAWEQHPGGAVGRALFTPVLGTTLEQDVRMSPMTVSTSLAAPEPCTPSLTPLPLRVACTACPSTPAHLCCHAAATRSARAAAPAGMSGGGLHQSRVWPLSCMPPSPAGVTSSSTATRRCACCGRASRAP